MESQFLGSRYAAASRCFRMFVQSAALGLGALLAIAIWFLGSFVVRWVIDISVGGASVLSSTTRADGFVIVSDDSEGYAEGTEVDVWLYA